MTNNRIRPRWNPGLFIALNTIVAALMFSWIYPATRAMWDKLDERIFLFLNGTLNLGKGWSAIWAVGNSRYIDIFVGIVLVSIMLRKNIIFKKIEVRRALFTAVGLVLLLIVVHVGFIAMVNLMELQRQSPSRVMPETTRLSELYPWMKKFARMKDSSPRSFPGDHASVLMLWAIFVGLFAKGFRVWIPVSLAVLFSLPRLIAGAHWFSDVAVGSTTLALFVFAWGYCTPIGWWLDLLLEKLTGPLLSGLRHVPMIKKLSLLK